MYDDSSKLFNNRNYRPYITEPRENKILCQCLAGSVLPHGEKVPFKPWLATPLVMVSQ